MAGSFKVTFITPHVGRKDPADLDEYVRTWQMANLPVATLAGLTPDDVELAFFDERVEFIDFDDPTDLAAITTETFNAKRAYEIAGEYASRGVRTIAGGYHAMLAPEEVELYTDSVLVGFAEDVWQDVIADARAGRLKKRYARDPALPMRFGMPDRTILGDRDYLPLSLIETGRGCSLGCSFCAITAANGAIYSPRPIDQVVEEISGVIDSGGSRNVFFVDDNIAGNRSHAKDLFRELAPLKIRWFSQGTIAMSRDDELLRLLADSGCAALLVGFESLKKQTLLQMNKRVNVPFVDDVREAASLLHDHGIAIYGTFIFGFDETIEDFKRTVDAALEMRLFMAAFNPLIPFPGTPLYRQLVQDGRMNNPRWWLDPDFRFGEVPFEPRYVSPAELHNACIQARRRFYSWRGIAGRSANVRGNLTGPVKAAAFLYINWKLRREITEKDGIPLGNEPVVPLPQAVSDASALQL